MNEFNKHGTFSEGGAVPPLLHPAQKATDDTLGAQVQPPKDKGVPLRTQGLGRKQPIIYSLGEDLLASVGTSWVLSYWMVGGPGNVTPATLDVILDANLLCSKAFKVEMQLAFGMSTLSAFPAHDL